MLKYKNIFLLFLLFFLLKGGVASNILRFPSPEFSSNYEIPSNYVNIFRSNLFEYLDVLILFICLLLISFLALKKRSRQALYILTLFSLIYFGFYKKGCVCSVGSIQNISLSFFDSNYMLPFSVLLFFILPLFFSLFFGRVFCSSICPLGAIQEVLIFKTIKIPYFIKQILQLIPFLYLGIAVLFAATDTSFIICKYDPFIGIYRMSGFFMISIISGIFIIIGMFISRPYCRFLCPYGVLLGTCSYLSKNHIKICPKECIKCRLCENSCPVDAIEYPNHSHDSFSNIKKYNKNILIILFIPLIIFGLGYSTSLLKESFSKFNKKVILKNLIIEEKNSNTKSQNIDVLAFKEYGKSFEELEKDVFIINKRFGIGSWILGFFIGFVISIKLLVLMFLERREIYEPNRFHCISCGRCMEYCPVK